MICATWPYLLRTYSMTFCRPSWQMSMSISGISFRLGSMNRSNSRPYLIGSTLQSPSRYPTIVPTPEPLAPTGMPLSRAKLQKSQTIRKYEQKFLPVMIFSS